MFSVPSVVSFTIFVRNRSRHARIAPHPISSNLKTAASPFARQQPRRNHGPSPPAPIPKSSTNPRGAALAPAIRGIPHLTPLRKRRAARKPHRAPTLRRNHLPRHHRLRGHGRSANRQRRALAPELHPARPARPSQKPHPPRPHRSSRRAHALHRRLRNPRQPLPPALR